MRIELAPHDALSSAEDRTTGSARRMAVRIVDGVAALLLVALTGAVLSNIFLMQSGHRPAPLLGSQTVKLTPEPKAAPAGRTPSPAQPAASTVFAPPMTNFVPQPAATPAPVAAAPRDRDANGALLPPAALPGVKAATPLVAELQRELARRGFYDGPADGVMGPKTEAAIRSFEQGARLKVTGEPTDALLAQVRRAPSIASLTGGDAGIATGSVRPPAEIPGANRILLVQKTLAKLGYGPLKPDGRPGTETRLAIQRFERDRNLPITGEITDKVVRELSAVSGTAIE
ncbi:MAG: hypothetical protein B7Z15_01255 [Rhizobiales bacterium 32-66-8]|nr:MAG: hypothetical protein B7Z15_01255 [Rhizobiales bacterium 32-66-8]